MRDDCCCRGGRLPVSLRVGGRKNRSVCVVVVQEKVTLAPSCPPSRPITSNAFPRVCSGGGGLCRMMRSQNLGLQLDSLVRLVHEERLLVVLAFETTLDKSCCLSERGRCFSQTFEAEATLWLYSPQIGKANRAGLIRDLQHQCRKIALAPRPLQKAPWEFSKRVLSLGSKQPKLSCHWHPLNKCLCSRIKHKTLAVKHHGRCKNITTDASMKEIKLCAFCLLRCFTG